MSSIAIPSLTERRAEGKKLRDRYGRADQAKWEVERKRDILTTIKEANTGRLPKLIPMKMGLMKVSPFAFFRGTAALLAKDVAETPTTGMKVQLCGDAHVKNLGAYAGPDGNLVFDINDFDETIAGPWEWDLKRLATSIVLAGREAGETDCTGAVRELVACYRESLDFFSRMKVLELAKYEIRGGTRNQVISEVLAKAERVTSARNLRKLTEPAKGGWRRFHDNLPSLRHVPEETQALVLEGLKGYRETVTASRQLILDAYHPVDIAFKVVGTGSVGTRDYVVLLFGNGLKDPLFLQVKEEMQSCYARYLKGTPRFGNEGQRAAQGQQRMQTVTDPFLGWTRIEGRDFLVRQLADHKAAIDPRELEGDTLLEYAVVCGRVLAKAHARTGDAAMIYGYCGDSGKLDKAIATFAIAYAEQTEADYEVFVKAIDTGKVRVIPAGEK